MNTHEENVAIATAAVVETLYKLTDEQAQTLADTAPQLTRVLAALATAHAMARDAREGYWASLDGRVAQVLAVAAWRT